MRIIAGRYRSRKLLSPPAGSPTRPIPDRVKEALFGILRGNVEGAVVLDAFAGTGAIGLEAISRGAERCVFIERDKRVAEMLRANIRTLGCGDQCDVIVGDALGISILARAPRPVDLVFFDPPYPMVLDAMPGGGWERVRGQFGRLIDLLSDDGFAVLRTPWPFLHPDDPAAAPAAEESPRRGPGRRGRNERQGRDGNGSRGGRREHLVHTGRGWTSSVGGELDDEGEDDEGLDLGDYDEADFVDEVDLDALEEAEAAPKPPERIPHHDVDLRLPNAVGPETHVYRHTALHFYMRRREGDGESRETTGAEPTTTP